MRRNPELVAWTILWLSFAVFCLLAVSIPWGIRHYIITATNLQEATLEVINGTVLVDKQGTGTFEGYTRENGAVAIPEGSHIKTDANSRALITFFENSTASLSTETEVRLTQMRKPRFGLSPRPNLLILDVKGGTVSLGAAGRRSPGRRFEVRSPQMVALLEEGNYEVEVTNEASQFLTYNSQATVTAAGQTVTLGPRERTTVAIGLAPSPPLPAARDLVADGDFTQPLEKNWQIHKSQGGDGGDIDGEVAIMASGDRDAVRFYRSGAGGNNAEVGIVQEIDKELPPLAQSLVLHAEVRLVFQSLSGGGYQSSEYPVILRLNYKDEYGSEAHWYHGFYYQNRDNNPTMNGELIPRNVWVPYRSENLLETLQPRPFYITSLQIYASGWDYEGLVSRVRLIVE
ncbi:MAG: hypothetical protein ACE5MB_05330 [Anaerolineae bacterium]